MQSFVDHRDLIAQYDLGHIEQHSPGLIHWHPAGVKVLRRLEQWVLALHQQQGYQEVRSPAILSRELWEVSGHWDKYQDLMFVAPVEDGAYAVKPMSCPGHIGIYKHRRRSYRELPFRCFEFGHVHRNEPSGALSGWMRLRGFVQDDSHVLCDIEQIQGVIKKFVAMVEQAYAAFGFSSWSWRLSLRPERRAGSDEQWNRAEAALRQACEHLGIDVVEAPGDGAFYGPKLEAAIEDRLGRQWQCGVAQVDFVLPERFDLEFQGASGERERPVMIHHAVLGSLERWLSIVMEQQGELPAWLSPHQVALLPIGEDQEDYCYGLAGDLSAGGMEAHVLGGGPLPGRIRQAQEAGYAFIAVVGKREVAQGQVSARQEDGKSVVEPAVSWIDRVVKACRAPDLPKKAAAG